MYDLWTASLFVVAGATKGVQWPFERASNHLYRWALLLRNYAEGRRASR